MSPMQYRYRSDFDRVVKYTNRLHDLMASGEYWRLGFLERRKLVRRINRLYKRLTGVFQLKYTKTVLLAAGVIGLTGCPEAGITEDDLPELIVSIEGDQLVNNVVDAGTTVTFSAGVENVEGAEITVTWTYDGDVIDGETGTSVDILIDDSYPNVHTISVEATDGERSASQTATVTARIDPDFVFAGIPDLGIDTDYMGIAYGSYINTDNPLTGMLMGDLDGDGDLDALVTASSSQYPEGGVAGYSAYMEWFSGDGADSPSFSRVGEPAGDLSDGLYSYTDEYGELVDTYTYTFHKPLDLADFDNDGDADLLTGTFQYVGMDYGETSSYSTSFGFTLFTNDSTGNAPDFSAVGGSIFTATFPYFSDDTGTVDYYNVTDYIASAELVDLDDDGDLDLVISYKLVGEDRALGIAMNSAGIGNVPTFGDITNISTTNVHDYVSTGDFDLDGDVDILTGNTYVPEVGKTFYFFENTGTPEAHDFSNAYTTNAFGIEDAVTYAAVPYGPFEGENVDIDGDGDLDVISGWYIVGFDPYSYAPTVIYNDSLGDAHEYTPSPE